MKELRVLSVCGMGFGTSLMTYMNIEELGQKYGVHVTGEACDLGSCLGKPCDVIVASTEIADQIHDPTAPVVGIKNILDKDELEMKMKPFMEQSKERED